MINKNYFKILGFFGLGSILIFIYYRNIFNYPSKKGVNYINIIDNRANISKNNIKISSIFNKINNNLKVTISNQNKNQTYLTGLFDLKSYCELPDISEQLRLDCGCVFILSWRKDPKTIKKLVNTINVFNDKLDPIPTKNQLNQIRSKFSALKNNGNIPCKYDINPIINHIRERKNVENFKQKFMVANEKIKKIGKFIKDFVKLSANFGGINDYVRDRNGNIGMVLATRYTKSVKEMAKLEIPEFTKDELLYQYMIIQDENDYKTKVNVISYQNNCKYKIHLLNKEDY